MIHFHIGKRIAAGVVIHTVKCIFCFFFNDLENRVSSEVGNFAHDTRWVKPTGDDCEKLKRVYESKER